MTPAAASICRGLNSEGSGVTVRTSARSMEIWRLRAALGLKAGLIEIAAASTKISFPPGQKKDLRIGKISGTMCGGQDGIWRDDSCRAKVRAPAVQDHNGVRRVFRSLARRADQRPGKRWRQK